MLEPCAHCYGLGYFGGSGPILETRCYRCNGKGFFLPVGPSEIDETVTNITEKALDNSNSTQAESGLSWRHKMPYQVTQEAAARLYNLYRDLAWVLDCIQPGLVHDPHSDADSADAQILINLADELRKGNV